MKTNRMPSFKMKPISLFLLATTTSTAQMSLAAEHIEEVIVRSSPLQSGLDEIVLGTTVLEREALLRNMNSTIGETLANQPGVSSTFFGPGASRPVIRGQGGDRIRVLSNDISSFDVSTASNDHLVATEVANAEQVEIIRGASTLRYGQNAVGGVVNVFDKRIPKTRPDDDFEAELTAGFSTVDDGYTVGGSLATSLNDNLVLYVDANDRDADPYEIDGFASDEAEEEGVKGEVENSQSEATSGTAGLSWIGEKGYIGFSIGVQEGVYGLPGGKKKEEEEEEEEELEEEEEGPITIDFEQVRIDLDGEYNFNSSLVKLGKFRLGYSDYEHTEFAGSEPETEFTNDEWEFRAEAFLQDFKLDKGTVTGTVGINIADREFEADGDEAFVPMNEQFRWGVFGLGRYSAGALITEASIRFDSQDNETSNLAFNGGNYDETENTYSAALTGIYNLSDTSTIGVNFARSERAPTAEELFSNGFHPATQTVEIGDVNLDTEVSYSTEFSYKTKVGNATFGANVYFIDYSDYIFLSPTGDFLEDEMINQEEGVPVFVYQQADAELYGFEFEADYLAVTSGDLQVTFDGQIDLARGKTTESTTFGGVDNVRDDYGTIGSEATTVGEGDLPFFPPVRILVGANFDYKPLKSTFRFEVQHVGSQDRVGEVPEGTEVEVAGTIPTDNYTFYNMYLTSQPFASDNITLSLRALNVTDEFARSATSFLSQSAPLPGRNLRFGVNVKF